MLYFFTYFKTTLWKTFLPFLMMTWPFSKSGCGAGLGDIGDLYVVDGNTALLHEAAALTLRCNEAGFLHEVENVDCAVGEVGCGDLGGRACSRSLRRCRTVRVRLPVPSGFLAPCTIWVSSNARISFARFSWLPFPAFHLFNLVKRQERQHLDALQNVAVVYVSPVLARNRTGKFCSGQATRRCRRFCPSSCPENR